MKIFISLVLILSGMNLSVQAQEFTSPENRELSFNNLDSLLTFAEKNSATIKTNKQQILLAKYEKIAAITSTINICNQVLFTLTDNNQLPIYYVPSEIFGGPAGSYRELTLGQQYTSNFSITPQIDIVNPAAWAKVKSATIGQELANNNNLINKKSLFESIAACFYNITSLQEHIELIKQNLFSTDTLLMIVRNKYSLGLVRQQDVNDAMANKLTLEDKLKQLQVALEQQYNSLKILLDIPLNENLTITDKPGYDQPFNADLNVNTDLLYKSSQLETERAKADLKCNRLSHLPVVSLFYSYSSYQNSNNHFFDENVNTSKWLNASYAGAKLTFCFPDLNRVALTNKSRINYTISRTNLEHSKYQNDISNRQLQLDYEKAYSQFFTSQQISLLKEQNYKMAFDQYSQAILSFDKLLIAFNEMLVSRLNYSSALAGLLYSKTIIDLNNSIK